MTSPTPLLCNTFYHIYNRGVNGENVFIEERNYELFLRLYERHLAPVTDLFAYCMLKNHFHLAVRVKAEEEIIKALSGQRTGGLPANGLPAGMGIPASPGAGRAGKPLEAGYASAQFSNFFNAYAKTINKAYGRTGSLFQHPFGRVPITTERRFWNVIAYIHQNPQKHGFVKDFRDWAYSSYGILLTEKYTPVNRAEVMEWFGTQEGYVALHREWMVEAKAKWFAGEDYD